MNSKLLSTSLLAFSSILASAKAAYYVPEEGRLNISTGISFTQFDEFYADEARVPTPGNEEIERLSFRNYFFYGLGNNLSADFSFGYADVSGFDTGNGSSRDDFTDLTFGLGWQFLEESADGFDAFFRFGVSLETDYEVGDLQAPGDGANGTDYTFKIGKYLTESGIRGDAEVTYYQRSSDVPDTILFKGGATFPLAGGWALDSSLTYFTSIEDGLDIGGPGFSLGRLPEVEEEAFMGQIGIAYSAGEYGYWRLSVSEVFDGRNIGKETTVGISYSFGFDLK